MKIFTNVDFLRFLSFIALLSVIDVIFGFTWARNVTAVVIIFVAMWNVFKYAEKAWGALHNAFDRDYGKLVSGHVIAWSGIGCREVWTWIVRDAGNPPWMLDFFLGWVFAAWIGYGGYLTFAASADYRIDDQPKRFYYVFLGIAVGLVLGVLATRIVAP